MSICLLEGLGPWHGVIRIDGISPAKKISGGSNFYPCSLCSLILRQGMSVCPGKGACIGISVCYQTSSPGTNKSLKTGSSSLTFPFETGRRPEQMLIRKALAISATLFT